MQKLKLGCINCNTKEEQEMVLDIFEMLGYTWYGGENPKEYPSYMPPMYYSINDMEKGRFTHGIGSQIITTEAKNLCNMWISLKRRKSEHEIK